MTGGSRGTHQQRSRSSEYFLGGFISTQANEGRPSRRAVGFSRLREMCRPWQSRRARKTGQLMASPSQERWPNRRRRRCSCRHGLRWNCGCWRTHVYDRQFLGDRARIRAFTGQMALDHLRRRISKPVLIFCSSLPRPQQLRQSAGIHAVDSQVIWASEPKALNLVSTTPAQLEIPASSRAEDLDFVRYSHSAPTPYLLSMRNRGQIESYSRPQTVASTGHYSTPRRTASWTSQIWMPITASSSGIPSGQFRDSHHGRCWKT